MKLINKYLNGNVTVTLFDNGTKIQEWDDNNVPNPVYPNSMDIKITDYCDRKPLCAFCHEKSDLNGKHADLEYLLDILQDLPKGTELAIGGGNPLAHPSLIPFLETCRSFGLIPNLTINYTALYTEKYVKLINKLIDEKLVYGVGLSIPDDFTEYFVSTINNRDNVVYHVIAGVNSLSILSKIRESCVQKCLILGYKDYGRGLNYRSQEVTFNLENWADKLGHFIKKVHLSFDNLALEQLNIKQYLTEEEWNSFYMGADGVFTMYIDAVKQQFAMSSTNETRYSLIGDIEKIFNTIKVQKLFETTK